MADLVEVRSDADRAVLTVARCHSTRVAAEWSGRTVSAVRALRYRTGEARGRGHPSAADLLREQPRASCPCPYCHDARDRARAAIQAKRLDLSRGQPREVGDVDPAPEWRKAAACAGGDPDDWFPVGSATAPGREVCRTVCPVRAECLEYALANRIDHGTWGGESERARRRILRQRAGT